MKHLLKAGLGLVLGVMLAGGAAASPWFLAPCAQYYEWTEDAFGLKESGPLLGVSLENDFPGGPRWGGRGSLLLFFGEAGYDGFKQDSTPYRTKTLYVGGDLRGSAHMRCTISRTVELQPFAGAGSRLWKRRLDNTDEMNSGYDEDWINLYVLAGARAVWQAAPGPEVTLEAGLRQSLYTYERVYFEVAGSSSVPSLAPANRASGFAALSIARNGYRLKLFYEGLRFGASELDRSGFYQPASEATLLGCSFGIQW